MIRAILSIVLVFVLAAVPVSAEETLGTATTAATTAVTTDVTTDIATTVTTEVTTAVTTEVTTVTTIDPAAYGSIYVGSYPVGASVYRDTEYVGTSPLTIPNFTAGNYTILLQNTGYADWSDSIAVTPGNQTTVYQVLTSLATPTTTATETTAPEMTLLSTITSAQTIVHNLTTIRIPTPWPTDTPAASPVDLTVILGGIFMGIVVLRR